MEANPLVTGNSAYFHKYYSGKIDDKYAFAMDLKNVDGVLSGTYRYDKRGVDIYLEGKIAPSGSFTIEETYPVKGSGFFTGVIDGNTLKGTWQKDSAGRKLHFYAEQTSEIKIGSKKEILTKVIGDYPLKNISGAGGANGMWDTWKDKGRWRSNVSGISGGMRQGNEIKLNRADIRLLNSMKVHVDSKLNAHLVANGRTILTIPYLDNGMVYKLRNEYDSVVGDYLKKFSPKTTVLDEELYLLVEDDVDYSQALSGNFEAVVSGIITVSYSIVKDEFAVSFRTSQCCDNTSFTFSRR